MSPKTGGIITVKNGATITQPFLSNEIPLEPFLVTRRLPLSDRSRVGYSAGNIQQKRFIPAQKIGEGSLFRRPISTEQWTPRGNFQEERA
jgi:hypothetical protein